MTRRGAWVLTAAAVATLSGCAASEEPVTTLDADRWAAVAELSRARDVQGVCYGWAIVGSAPNSAGSSLGVGVGLPADPTLCQRWVKLVADVRWTPESSEIEDSASVYLNASDDLLPSLSDDDLLPRLGLTLDEVIDDPDYAVLRGVLVLPLMVAEAGLAAPLPRPTATVTPDPARLPAAGSDFLRDRGVLLFVGIGALLVAGGLLWLGLWRRRREAAREAARRERTRRKRVPAKKSAPKSAVEDLEADTS